MPSLFCKLKKKNKKDNVTRLTYALSSSIRSIRPNVRIDYIELSYKLAK
ncbi:hypothetical protein AGMMS49936_11960 [Endomicrobiia bacterium]|nr:hypothetical protein AGMMS49936_11960 [Endomicrobiia bacterium]